MQSLIDAMSREWRKERSATQLTLGKLISVLESMPPDFKVQGIGNPHSYRGYYSDLAFESLGGRRKCSELLRECKGIVGEVFQGYKGGDFPMSEDTPLWLAMYGMTGDRLMSVNSDGSFATAPEEY